MSTELPWKALAEGPQEDRRQIEIDAAVETAKNKAREIRNTVQELREILFFIGKK